MLASLILLFFVVGAWGWLARVPFHEDEAIYAAWAFAIARGDWLLWVTPVDKPPLTLYPLATLIALGANSEWLLRLPSFFWGLLGIWAVGRIATTLGRDKWSARALLLCSPLWWTLWASAFTDMAAVALALFALQSGERRVESGENGGQGARSEERGMTGKGRNGEERQETAKGRGRLSLAPIFRLGNGARREMTGNGGLETTTSASWLGQALRGIALAGAILAKPTMVFLLALFFTSPPNRYRVSTLERGNATKKDTFWLSFIGVLLFAWAWDASRTAPSWWRLGTEAYGTLGHVGIEIAAWLWITLGALGLIGIASILLHFVSPSPPWRRDSGRGVRFGRETWSLNHALLITVLLWLPLHILLGFQPWERYLLPLAPLTALLLAPYVSGSAIPSHDEDVVVSNPSSPNLKVGTRDTRPRPFAVSCRSLLFLSVPAVPCRFLPFLSVPAVPRASLLIPLLLLAPFLAAPFHFAPQDRRWDNIAEIGTVIEQLPPTAEVWYADMGRPLAWYAKNTKATLQWGGTHWKQFPGCVPTRYLIARLVDPLPTTTVVLVETRGQFGLWGCDK